MKYAMPFLKSFRYKNELDEIIMRWSIDDDIVDYVTSHFNQEQRVTILFALEPPSKEDMAILFKLLKEHPNLSLKLNPTTVDDVQLRTLRDSGFRYYFNKDCDSWDAVYGQIQRGVSDITVVETLAFDLKRVKQYCEPRRVKIRVYPNIAQNGGIGIAPTIPDITKFFIRPEDTTFYSQYVDVFEFWGNDDRVNPIYDIYKREQWTGALSQIIACFNDEVPNTGIMPEFPLHRVSCQKKCMMGKCRLCQSFQEVADTLTENNIAVMTQRRKVIHEIHKEPNINKIPTG